MIPDETEICSKVIKLILNSQLLIVNIDFIRNLVHKKVNFTFLPKINKKKKLKVK